ncbi:hypothetical protein M9458_036263, partial [Cirrhinus mrigala]
PPASLLTLGDSSGPPSWQTESLPVSLTGHESWAQVGMMDPEDAKSLDSTEGVALVEEQSENNSSNSDIVHVEREDAELLEEGGETLEEGELQSSVLSVLGSESELAAVREEAPTTEAVQTAPETIVEPDVMEIPPPPASVEEEDPATHEVTATASFSVPEPELQSQPLPAPVEPQSSSPLDLEPEVFQETLEQKILPEVNLKATSPAHDLSPEVQTETSDLPVLLYGGAALVAIAAVLAFGALAYRK